MASFILRRCLQTLFILFLSVFMVFATMRLAPGGPFSLERPPPPKVLANLRAFYDLDLGYGAQFGAYLFGMAGREILPPGSVDENGDPKTFGRVYWTSLPQDAAIRQVNTGSYVEGQLNIRQFCPWGVWSSRALNGGFEYSKREMAELGRSNQGRRLHKCGLVRLDLGLSLITRGLYVNDKVRQGLPATLRYAVPSLLFCLFLGVPMGIFAAYKHNQWSDYTLTLFAVIGTVTPNVVMAPLLQYFLAFKTGWFPGFGAESWLSFVVPTIVLGTALLGRIMRLTRAAALEALNSNFIRTARAKGVPAGAILFRHVLRPAIMPVLTYIAPVSAVILTGSVIIESQFQIGGLGTAFVEGALQADYTVLLGTTVVLLVAVILLNLIVDIAAGFLDPRVRAEVT